MIADFAAVDPERTESAADRTDRFVPLVYTDAVREPLVSDMQYVRLPELSAERPLRARRKVSMEVLTDPSTSLELREFHFWISFASQTGSRFFRSNGSRYGKICRMLHQ